MKFHNNYGKDVVKGSCNYDISLFYSLIYRTSRSANAFTSMALCMEHVMGLMYMLMKCVEDTLFTKKQHLTDLS